MGSGDIKENVDYQAQINTYLIASLKKRKKLDKKVARVSLALLFNQLREDSNPASLESRVSCSGAHESTQLVYFYHNCVKVLVKVPRIITAQGCKTNSIKLPFLSTVQSLS